MAPIKQFPLPDVGEGLTEAEILSWRVAVGDTVAVNQIIIEIETAKAAVELPCPWAGVVTELFAESGATVRVGEPLIAIDLDPTTTVPAADRTGTAGAARTPSPDGGTGESRTPNLVGYGPRTAAVTRRPRKGGHAVPVPAESTASTGHPAPPEAAVSAVATPTEGDVTPAEGDVVPQAKPPVRKLARELGIDLRTVPGSGAGGVITREDVQRAADPEPARANGSGSTGAGSTGAGSSGAGSSGAGSSGAGSSGAGSSGAGSSGAGSSGAGSSGAGSSGAGSSSGRQRREPIRGVRRATAAAMVASAFTAPHVTEFLTLDVTPMMELRARLKGQPRFRDVKLTPLAFAARALCLAIRRTPEANASWDEEAGEIAYFDYVHLGIAAATPRGLVVPKIRDADRMSLRELAVALEDLTTTAREGRTPPGDMTGGTITITNVGVYGVDTGTPILNPGESAILALGAIRDMPWVVDGTVAVRKVCQLALSFDHRVVDGQQGSEFLAELGALLADPALAITY